MPSQNDLNILLQSDLFKNTEIEKWKALITSCDVVELEKGKILLEKGQENEKLYIILSGQISIDIMNAQKKITIQLREGECLGELSLLDNKPVSATVITDVVTRFLVIQKKSFLQLIDLCPVVARNMLFILLSRIRRDKVTIDNTSDLVVQYAKDAMVDGLTQIYNRKWLDENFHQTIASSVTNHSPVVLAIIDIDHFKKVNDNYGHRAGDLVLKQLSAILKNSIRESDLLARYGGEEFSILYNNTTLQEAVSHANALRESICNVESFIFENLKLPGLTISIGLAELVPEDTLDTLISKADTALYQAKESGRNCIKIYCLR